MWYNLCTKGLEVEYIEAVKKIAIKKHRNSIRQVASSISVGSCHTVFLCFRDKILSTRTVT